MTTRINVARIIGVLSLLVAVAGCSAIKLGYNNFPEVAYWWLDGYIDFQDPQPQRVREDLARVHAWHRANELPRIVELLERMEQLAAADITPQQACAFVPQLRERMSATAERAEPALVTNALTFTSAQLRHLERKFNENNARFRKDWVQLSSAALLDKRVRQAVERAEMIYGTLNEAQRAAARAVLENSSWTPQRALAERQRRQQDILQTLRTLAGQPVPLDQARAAMRRLLARLSGPTSAAQKEWQESVTQENCRVMATVHNSTSAEQRESAVRRLRAYQRDLRELSSPQ